jgi:hypothetical protein
MHSTGIITLYEVLQQLQSGAVCSITYVAADRKRGKGGKMVRLPQCNICKLSAMPANILRRNNISATTLGDDRRWADHHAHKTRNVYIPKTQEIKKLHIKLITEFNGKRVLL